MLAHSVFYLFLPRNLQTSKLMLLCVFLDKNNSSSSRLAQLQGKINSCLSWLRRESMGPYNTMRLHSSAFVSIQRFSHFTVKYNGRNPSPTKINDTSLRLLQIHNLTLDLNLHSLHQMHYFSFLTESITFQSPVCWRYDTGSKPSLSVP